MIARLAQGIKQDRRNSIDYVATLLGVSHDFMQSTLYNDLKMQLICEYVVPRSLTYEQREERQLVSGDLIERVEQDPTLLQRVNTGDETWCFLYDPQPKRQSSTWKSPGSPRQKSFRTNQSKGKVMLEVFFDIQSLIHFEFFLRIELSVRRRTVCCNSSASSWCSSTKRHNFWQWQNWVLHNDNAPANRSLLVSVNPRKIQKTCLSTATIFSRSWSKRFRPISKGQIPTKGAAVCVSWRGENSYDVRSSVSEQRWTAGVFRVAVWKLAELCYCPVGILWRSCCVNGRMSSAIKVSTQVRLVFLLYW